MDKYRQAAIRRNKEYVTRVKESIGECADCGASWPPCAMDFDHVTGIKNQAITRLVSNGCSLDTIEAEIEKCDLVCACCHRMRTEERR